MVVGGVMTFALVASVIQPMGSSASPEEFTPARAGAANDPAEVVRSLVHLKHPRGWALLGVLAGREYYVLVHSSPEGPRYSVFGLNGRLMEADLAGDDVYRSFPNLDVPGMRFGPEMGKSMDQPLMLAEPRHE